MIDGGREDFAVFPLTNEIIRKISRCQFTGLWSPLTTALLLSADKIIPRNLRQATGTARRYKETPTLNARPYKRSPES